MSDPYNLEYHRRLHGKPKEDMTEEERTGLLYETTLTALVDIDLDEFRLLNQEFIQWKRAQKARTAAEGESRSPQHSIRVPNL